MFHAELVARKTIFCLSAKSVKEFVHFGDVESWMRVTHRELVPHCGQRQKLLMTDCENSNVGFGTFRLIDAIWSGSRLFVLC